MVKVSISLPNNAHITFESEESEVLHEVVGMVLRDLPRELMQAASSDGGDANGIVATSAAEKSTAVAPTVLSAAVTAPEPVAPAAPETAALQTIEQPEPAPPVVSEEPVQPPTEPIPEPAPETNAGSANAESADSGFASSRSDEENSNSQAPSVPPEFLSESGQADFVAFCREANPLGDMRRVVVAAVAASHHFGVDGVNADHLAWLFDLAGWRKPGNFTQTLRNAARSKFGWLERIPGRSGRYAATPLGITKTLSAS